MESRRASDWEASGETREVFGRRVFVRREQAADASRRDRAPLLVLHGFPTSSFDFRSVLPALGRSRPVVVHDHLGFGLSDKPEGTYSLIEQAELALEVWRQLGIRAGHLVAHDYGTSVATEILARRERGGIDLDVRSLTLCNGSVHIELARLTAAQRILESPVGPAFARLSNRKFFAAQIRRTFARPDAVDAAEIDAMWELLERADGRLRIPAITSYLAERRRFWSRWVGALCRLDRPAHVLWGRLDPIAVPAIAEQLAREIPGARLTWLDGVAHYPMVEAPERWANELTAFVDSLEPGGS